MKEQDLENIKSRQLFLKPGQKSSEVVLADPTGDMYFTFELNYINDNMQGTTKWSSKGSYSGEFKIDTRPNSVTKPISPIKVGTYGKENKSLYVGFVVMPQIPQTGEHEVTVTFYLGKEDRNGASGRQSK